MSLDYDIPSCALICHHFINSMKKIKAYYQNFEKFGNPITKLFHYKLLTLLDVDTLDWVRNLATLQVVDGFASNAIRTVF